MDFDEGEIPDVIEGIDISIKELVPSYTNVKGSAGKKFVAITNHYPLKVRLDSKSYRYRFDAVDAKGLEIRDVTFVRKVLKAWANIADSPLYKKPYAFDGSHLIFSDRKLLDTELVTSSITLRDDGPYSVSGCRTIELTLKDAGVVDLNVLSEVKAISHKNRKYCKEQLAAIQYLNVVLRHFPAQSHYTVSGSMYLMDDSSTFKELQRSGINLHNGFYTSCRMLESGLTLNVDTVCTTFYKAGPVLNIITNMNGLSADDNITLNAHHIEKINDFFSNLKIDYVFPDGQKRSCRIYGFSELSISELTFELDGEVTTVKSYLEGKYKCNFRYPKLQCLNTSKNPERGNSWMPIEYAMISERQLYRKKLEGDLSSEMIKYACLTPSIKIEGIKSAYQRFKSPPRLYETFGIGLSDKLYAVNARLLPPEPLRFGIKSIVPIATPINGSWILKNKNLMETKLLNNWHVVCFNNRSGKDAEKVKKFIETLLNSLKNLGVSASRPVNIHNLSVPSTDPYQAYNEFSNCFKNLNYDAIQLIVVILPSVHESEFYNAVKFSADVDLGIPTQCVSSLSVSKSNENLCNNISLKINLKLEGINCVLNDKISVVSNSRTIVIGADISHPQKSGNKLLTGSVSSVVGSINSTCTKYVASVRLQKPNTESFSYMKDQLCEIFDKFYKINRHLPGRVIVYRDGVSEGDFSHLAFVEVNSISAAANAVNRSWKPKITYITTNKRHHTRILPTENDLMNYRPPTGAARFSSQNFPYSNIPPGTVVDDGITNPGYKNFFMVAHAGLKGTVKPVHYQVIHDGNDLSMDELEKMTFQLSHLFGRSTTIVSLVAPVYLAHVVSRRASVWYTYKSKCSLKHTNPYSRIDKTSKAQEENISVHPRLLETLWFV